MGVGFFNYKQRKKSCLKKVFGKGSKKNLKPELEAIKGFNVNLKVVKQIQTRAYKENLMQKRLGNEQKKMEDFATEKRPGTKQ